MSKFKNIEELEKAYQELEREFTKKSQKLALYEKTNYVALLNKEMDSLVDDYAKRRISDLEAKLAESQKEANDWKQRFESKEKQLMHNAVNGANALVYKQNKIKQLKQQLAEKEFAHNSYFEKAEATIKFLQQQFNEKGKIEGRLDQLKQQLAEKDAEIRVAYSFRKQKCDNLQKALAEKEEELMQAVKDWKSLVESKNQDKISFCIEKLEKVRHSILCNERFYFENLNKYIDEQIDNQIAELKKGVE